MKPRKIFSLKTANQARVYMTLLASKHGSTMQQRATQLCPEGTFKESVCVPFPQTLKTTQKRMVVTSWRFGGRVNFKASFTFENKTTVAAPCGGCKLYVLQLAWLQSNEHSGTTWASSGMRRNRGQLRLCWATHSPFSRQRSTPPPRQMLCS